jgi:hypothetical protein
VVTPLSLTSMCFTSLFRATSTITTTSRGPR